VRIPRWTILVLAPVLLAAATVPARAGEPGYGGLSRVGLRYETGPGTDIYAVDGQLDTGVRFLGGREFIGAGVTQVTSDRVNSRLMIDVASGLIWPRRVSPYITVGLMGGITGASTRTDGAGTSTSAIRAICQSIRNMMTSMPILRNMCSTSASGRDTSASRNMRISLVNRTIRSPVRRRS